MRFIAQGVQEEYVEAVKQVERRFGDLAVIGKIGRIAEEKTVDGSFSVEHRNRCDRQPEEIKRLAVQRVGLQFWDCRLRATIVLKNVAKAGPDGLERILRSVD